MIQPEPEDLPKDNPKLEIAVLRSVINELTSGEIVSLNFIESIKEARSRVQDLTSGEIVSLNFIESIKEARSRVQDLTSGEIVSLNLLSRTRKFGHSTMELRSLINFKHTLKHLKEELTFVELGSHLRIEESLRMQDNDKPKGNNVAGPSVVNMVEHNNSSRYNDNKGKRKHHDNTKADPNKKSKVTCWKCGKPRHLKKDCRGGKVWHKAMSGTKWFSGMDDDVAWWVDSGATVHVCKDRCWFKTYESLNDGSILHMGNESTALVHGRGCVDLKFSSGRIVFVLNIVNDNIASAFMSTSKLNDSILWHARLGHVLKRTQDMSKDWLISAFDIDTEKFSSVPKPSLRISNGTEDIGGSVVPEKVTEGVVVQQPEPELMKSKRNRTPKNFRPNYIFNYT
ncbi:zinc finger, CCHC-type containing protein [Tanacetum coccineum]